jgi:glycosyltransferase involved in cell wall biosynthesis
VKGIVLVGPSWPLRGGIARTTTALADALAAQGSLAAFLAPTRQYPRWLYRGSDVDPGACPRIAPAERNYAVLEPWTWPALRRRIRAATPRAVVVPYWTYAWAPLLSRVLAWDIAPAVAVVHNPADHDASAVARWAARGVLRRCHGFMCHSRSVEESLVAAFPGRPVAVHPLPPDEVEKVGRAAARRRVGVPDGAVAFLCFGLIRPYKGVEVVLDAFACLPAGCPAVLLLAGEPWRGLAAQITARLRGPRLSGRVMAALRWIPESEVGSWFAAADVAVLPYRTATGSAVAAQALGQGLPILATRVGGLAEVVEEGVNGSLVPPADAGAMSRAVELLCSDDVRARLAAGARASARRWTWASYAEVLETLVDAVAAAGPGARRARLGRRAS